MTKPTADEVRESSMITLASAHAVYVEAVREAIGEKGLEAIGEANRIHGLELGKSGIDSGGLRKGDLKSIYEFFVAAHPFFGFEIELGEHNEDRLDMIVTYCPWIEAFKAKGAKEDVCHWVTKMDEGIGQAVDPGLKMTLPKCMMRGDDHCIYRYEK